MLYCVVSNAEAHALSATGSCFEKAVLVRQQLRNVAPPDGKFLTGNERSRNAD